jgi:hypothetical protein
MPDDSVRRNLELIPKAVLYHEISMFHTHTSPSFSLNALKTSLSKALRRIEIKKKEPAILFVIVLLYFSKERGSFILVTCYCNKHGDLLLFIYVRYFFQRLIFLHKETELSNYKKNCVHYYKTFFFSLNSS